MDIVNIESHAWEMMMARFERFSERVLITAREARKIDGGFNEGE